MLTVTENEVEEVKNVHKFETLKEAFKHLNTFNMMELNDDLKFEMMDEYSNDVFGVAKISNKKDKRMGVIHFHGRDLMEAMVIFENKRLDKRFSRFCGK